MKGEYRRWKVVYSHLTLLFLLSSFLFPFSSLLSTVRAIRRRLKYEVHSHYLTRSLKAIDCEEQSSAKQSSYSVIKTKCT